MTALSEERNVYDWTRVCVQSKSPRASPHEREENKTARGRYECKNTQDTTPPNLELVLLLLLLQRIRNVVVVGYLRRVRIRFVYGVLAGGAR